jgi:peptide chain release factor subunit 3
MSNTPNSWEDAAGDDNELANHTRQMNINQQPSQQQQQQQQQPFRPAFNPGATFTPGAQAFVPGQSYGGYAGYNQQSGGYQQYQQPQYGQYDQYQQYGQYGQYGGQYGGYNQYQQPQQGYRPPHLQNQQQQQATPQIAKRSDDNPETSTPASTASSRPAKASTPSSAAPKVLKIGGDSAPKVLKIGGDATLPPKKEETPKKDTPSDTPEAGSKAAAAKAVAKSTATSGKSSPTPADGRSSPARSAAEKAAQKREADAVLKAQEEEVDDTTIAELYGKVCTSQDFYAVYLTGCPMQEHVNLVFIGHVDAGKSSLGGAILYATGMVDERTMDKYKREAKEQGRESWYLSWALDLTREERSKGKTVEVGRAYFETEKRRYSVLDAPGHKNYVPSMIGGASQADVGILVISARKGEYETGFEKGGQTREHAVLAKTQGVNKLIVAVNKMDESTVNWSKERYDECITKLTAFLRATGYNPKTDLMFMPLSALTGAGLKERIPKGLADWYNGPSLLEYLDSMQGLERKLRSPFMMPISGKYKDMGVVVEGKIESGVVKKGGSFLIMPGRTPVDVVAIYSESDEELPNASCGDQVRLRVRGIEEEEILPGFVLSSPKKPINCVSAFEAQLHILDLKSLLTSGFQCVMHVHTTVQEVTFSALLHKLEKGTGRKSKKPPPFASRGKFSWLPSLSTERTSS